MEIIEAYNNGYRYDAMFQGIHDIEFLTTEACKTGAPVLELCCGSLKRRISYENVFSR